MQSMSRLYPSRTLTASLLLLAGALAPPPLAARTDPDTLRISLENGSAEEEATAAQLRRVLEEHDVPPEWILTRDILIDEDEIPHSHPVLTLHTRHLGSDVGLLSAFLHEQFHWLEEANPDFRAAMEDFARLFPEAPAGSPEGARDRESTYRHLVVCDLELQAMSELIGEQRARRVLSSIRHYTWIYRTVLEDPRVREVNRRHGMTLDP